MKGLAVALGLGLCSCAPPPVVGTNRGELFVSVVGQEGEPALEVTYDVGPVAVGTSKAFTVRAVNVGSDELHVYGAQLGAEGNGSWFVRDTSANLLPEAALTVSVTFAPVAAGPQATTLTFSHDAAASTPVVHLTGTGS